MITRRSTENHTNGEVYEVLRLTPKEFEAIRALLIRRFNSFPTVDVDPTFMETCLALGDLVGLPKDVLVKPVVDELRRKMQGCQEVHASLQARIEKLLA